MRILQVNGYESPGRRFHGLSITPLLKEYGVDSRHLVWNKDNDNPEVLTFGETSKTINHYIHKIETIASLQSVLYRNAKKMMETSAFKEADLIHLHIIHSGYFSLGDLPEITKRKPTVWTLHDPWAMTGHCIYPKDCARWKIGCGNCPDLKSPAPLVMDSTKFLFNYKNKMYKKSSFDLIVASQWMQNMVESSPIFKNVRLHQVPFGLNLNIFSPNSMSNCRNRFGISNEALVICFRSDCNKFKGLSYIIEALKQIKARQLVCLITLGGKGLLTELADDFQIIEVGWSNDEEKVRDVIESSDIFLMPSIAEAFGMMAIEAMALSKPVIVFDGTSLPEVTFAPDIGISVPQNSEALTGALQYLIDNPDERHGRGKKGREIAESHYDEKDHVQRLIEVYKMVVNR